MKTFEPGTRVVVIDGDTNELRRGVIQVVYAVCKTAIVKFDDGNIEKVEFDCLGFEPEPAEPTEPVEKSEITITSDEFKHMTVDVALKMTEDTPLVGLVLMAFSAELYKALFIGESEK